jgi:ribosomal protein S18 acetylase RimI-like enzyme
VEIRRVRPDEWQALRDLRLRALATDPDAFGDSLAHASARTDADWQAYADRPDRVGFVAVTADGFVGMAMGGPAPDHPEVAGLYGMWVAPEARGAGVGTALIDAVEAWAREAGYGSIGLGVTTGNEPAIRLYSARGYTDTGDRFPLRDDTDLVVQIMVRSL